jgi:hypothetical protein
MRCRQQLGLDVLNVGVSDHHVRRVLRAIFKTHTARAPHTGENALDGELTKYSTPSFSPMFFSACTMA